MKNLPFLTYKAMAWPLPSICNAPCLTQHAVGGGGRIAQDSTLHQMCMCAIKWLSGCGQPIFPRALCTRVPEPPPSSLKSCLHHWEQERRPRKKQRIVKPLYWRSHTTQLLDVVGGSRTNTDNHHYTNYSCLSIYHGRSAETTMRHKLLYSLPLIVRG